MASKNFRESNVVAFSVREFFERFPNDDLCLEHVMEVRYGLRHPCEKCLNLSTFHRLSDRPAYSCAHCGHHVYPCAGTIFQDTRTPFQDRKSTRLNSSHPSISYAVFCLKKKKK